MPAHDALPPAPRRLDAMFTPGQRWSTAVIVVLALALSAAQPATREGFGQSFAPPAGSPSGTAPTAGAADRGPAQTDLGAPVVPADLGTVVVPSGGEGDRGPAFEATVPPVAPGMVALVRTGDGVPGRDDAAIAEVFLETAPFEVTILTVPADPDAQFCTRVAEAGRVAVTSIGVDRRLRDCLLSAGVLIVGFDTLGSSGGAGGAGIVSTRRGIRSALDDLTTWATPGDALSGRLGVVGTTTARPAVEAAVEQMRSAGLDVVATAFVSDGDSVGNETSDGVRAFATAEVQTVVLAAPVAQQRQWAAQQSVLLPGVRYVVADAYDAVVDETYPATFDGSIAHTSVRVPWFARENGETREQSRCRTRWEQQAIPPETLDSDELVKVFAWCQHVAMLTAAREAYVTAGGSFRHVLRSLRFTSPLTSDVGPLPDRGFGPAQDAVLQWRADCGCWTQHEPFTDRG